FMPMQGIDGASDRCTPLIVNQRSSRLYGPEHPANNVAEQDADGAFLHKVGGIGKDRAGECVEMGEVHWCGESHKDEHDHVAHQTGNGLEPHNLRYGDEQVNTRQREDEGDDLALEKIQIDPDRAQQLVHIMRGKLVKSFRAKLTISLPSMPAISPSVTATAMSFTAKETVCSCNCVSACSKLMRIPCPTWTRRHRTSPSALPSQCRSSSTSRPRCATASSRMRSTARSHRRVGRFISTSACHSQASTCGSTVRLARANTASWSTRFL